MSVFQIIGLIVVMVLLGVVSVIGISAWIGIQKMRNEGD